MPDTDLTTAIAAIRATLDDMRHKIDSLQPHWRTVEAAQEARYQANVVPITPDTSRTLARASKPTLPCDTEPDDDWFPENGVIIR